MTVTIGVLTPRAGQGSTTWALALAWDLAANARVLFVDADPQGGTATDYLALSAADGRQVGMSRLFGPPTVTAEMLEANSVAVPSRRGMRVVPGLSGFCGPGVASLLPRLREMDGDGSYFAEGARRRSSSSLAHVDADFVVVDLGAPLAHPELQAPHRVGETISAAFNRLFVVIRDDPVLLPHNLLVLQAARLARGELVLACRSGRRGNDRDLRRTVSQALEQNLPELTLSVEWPWDAVAAARSISAAAPISAPGMGRRLGIVPGQAAGVEVVAEIPT